MGGDLLTEVSSTPEEIMKDIEGFLGERFKEYTDHIKKTLETMVDPVKTFDEKVEAAGETLQGFWKEYSREHIAKVLEGFPKIQKALFGLELEPELGERYRDHFLHMFNIFIFGARVLSRVIQGDRDGKLLKELFKVTKEPEKVRTLFRTGEYTPAERLFFLWTLISTFHDVGIPIQHLPNLQKGLNSFLEHFGIRISEFSVEREPAVDCRLDYYLELMARIYDNGITLEEEKGEYKKTDRPHPYVYKALLSEYGQNSHGAISAICLYKSIEENFYKGEREEERLNLDMEEIEVYNDLVFEEDITRIALAIALHDAKPKSYPKIFPISFKKFPLLFLLIFCDELQEYFRLEGSSLKGVTLLKSLPLVDVSVQTDPPKIEIHISICYTMPSREEEETVKREIIPYYKKIGETPPGNFREHINKIWERICERLEKKLAFRGEPIRVTMDIYLGDGRRRTNPVHWDSANGRW